MVEFRGWKMKGKSITPTTMPIRGCAIRISEQATSINTFSPDRIIFPSGSVPP